jgi:hypothetical protein
MTTSKDSTQWLTGHTLTWHKHYKLIKLIDVHGISVEKRSLAARQIIVPPNADNRTVFLDKAFAFAQANNCHILEVSDTPNGRGIRAILSFPAKPGAKREDLDKPCSHTAIGGRTTQRA